MTMTLTFVVVVAFDDVVAVDAVAFDDVVAFESPNPKLVVEY
jgi:hypothetical protein